MSEVKKFYELGKNELFPLNRSITGEGVRQTLSIIKKKFPALKIKKIRSGTKVFDWKIPNEWNVKEAYVEDKNNKKIIDFKINNLHLVGYSAKVNTILNKRELLKKLFFLENKPNAVPYITSYYKKRWGFCVTYNIYKKIKKDYLNKDKFKIIINSEFYPKGNLNYAELVLKGKSSKEILISTYICHPSMANNELSGPIVSMSLINFFKNKRLNKTLRFIFIPETIGSISYLSKNLRYLKKNIIGGYNLSCIGDDRQHSCMFSKKENAPSDEAMIEAYKKLNIKKYKIYSFLKRGSDERQYNSPGIDLPISSIFRTKYGEYPEYHTSLDNFKLVTLKGLEGGYKVAKQSIIQLQNKIFPLYKNLCEPNLGKRNLYPTLSTLKKNDNSKNLLNFLQYSDGFTSLESISKKINLPFAIIKKIYLKLIKYDLVS